MLAEWLGGSQLTIGSAVTRMLMSLFASGLVGLERAGRRQVAGWRTHIIIGLGATLSMLLSIWVPKHITGGSGDSARIAAQVVSGIGFLGAGVFIKVGNNVKGMTTAATIWFAAGLGLAIGAGMWQFALIGLTLGLISLIALETVQRKIFPPERLKILQIWYNGEMPDLKVLKARLKKYKLDIETMDATVDFENGDSRLSILASVPVGIDLNAFFETIKENGDISKIRIHENY